ncbi:DUF2931 family protein [Agarilytica rhodophyticola]|uniref:DUF2931 family protein n=1 Tax=Agarilytica rhodophyticola TaxID=1737490 RepID=UPI000B343261|nr:DUF2931 family protein [Agarilytica rhodophyticola]
MFLLLSGCGAQSKFDWDASESAPQNYPMQVIDGRFFYHDSEGSLYIPDKSSISPGWGDFVSTHAVGPELKPLPNRLYILYFSYAENTFYEGTFDLPYDKILKLFQAGYFSPRLEKDITFWRITAGSVAVWITGVHKSIEVFFGQAEEVEVPWARVTQSTIPREEYVSSTLVEDRVSEEVMALIQQGNIPFDLWKNYRIKYNWQPIITNVERPPKLINHIAYLNGEEDYLYYPLDESIISATRAVPKRILFVWKSPWNKPMQFDLNFDEAEITQAFQTLAPEEQRQRPLKLEIHIAAKKRWELRARLRYQDTVIELEKTEVKIHLAAISEEKAKRL